MAIQPTQGVDPVSTYCWPTIFNAGTTLTQHEVNACCLMAGIPGEYRVHTYSTQGLIADIELSALILITRNKVKSKGSNCLLEK